MTARIRPAYHLTPRRGWLNDPLGVTFRDGRVHVFYHAVPDSQSWQAGCHWAHASSVDLLTWTEHPDALQPDDGEAGCWSGCVVADAGLMLYTAVQEPDLAVGRIRTATATDGSWDRWAKGDVVLEVPDGLVVRAFRDPFVWKESDGWRMLVGAAFAGGTAAALTFISPDLARWDYDGVFASRHTSERSGAWTGSLWECPQLVRVGVQEVLVVSVWHDDVLHHVAYARGQRSQPGRFDVTRWQQLTFGSGHYAASTFIDDEGHPGLVHWLRNIADADQGWAGALSVPQRLALRADELVVSAHPRVERGRGQVFVERQVVTGQTATSLPSWHCEIRIEPIGASAPVELAVNDGEGVPVLRLVCDAARTSWQVFRGGDSGSVVVPVPSHSAGATLLLDGPLAEMIFGTAGLSSLPLAVTAAAPPSMIVTRGQMLLTGWDRRLQRH